VLTASLVGGHELPASARRVGAIGDHHDRLIGLPSRAGLGQQRFDDLLGADL